MKEINIIHELSNRIKRPINLMEVCGTHTVAIFKSGIKSLLPPSLKLLSGPGCPVCVTAIEDIDRAVAYSLLDDVILTTFGDMLRVPGSNKSLMSAKAEGGHIEIVYSPLDSLNIAIKHKAKKIVFFSAGFETTAPLAAATLLEAEKRGISNFFLYSVHKLVPPALEVLLNSDDVRIDGFILPGHVSSIIGSKPYQFMIEKYKVPSVITGFKAEDIVGGIMMLLKQIYEGKPSVEIQYKSSVKPEGNQKAVDYMYQVFEPADSYWRGIGNLKNSGLKLKNEWMNRDSEKIIPLQVNSSPEPKGCQCGLILRGIKTPPECPLFEKVCSPENPVGACMVSTEGSCAAYFKYGR
ncbi:MAG TPA: hydrogenase formation protein HypD [Nitrospirae bacterium]|nr:hydrogenase formation protein HypD [Nitrospirota bacterium]